MEKIKLNVRKGDWEWFKEMQSEGRTRAIQVTTFRLYETDVEIELEVEDNDDTTRT